MNRPVWPVAAVALALSVSACGSSATPQPISYGCTNTGGVPIGNSDLTVDIEGLGLAATVELHVGETMTLGGGGCFAAGFPTAASLRPVLDEIGHHVFPVQMNVRGYTDVTYRATQPGRVTVKPGGAGVRPQTLTVVVLPGEPGAQAARRGTGTITITAAATGPVGTFALGGVSCRRVIDLGGEQPAPGDVTFRSDGLTYHVALNASDYGPPSIVQVGRPAADGVDWYIVASDPDPRTRPATLVDGGWVSGPIRPLDHGRSGGSIAIRWWC